MGWYGFDLDGTLAHYDEWKEVGIGEPIPKMAERLRAYLECGEEVRIVTARAGFPELIAEVEEWCERHFGVRLPVTDRKDFEMILLYDDRCRQVIPNTGEVVGE